jgi:hypothetical protein
MKTLDQVIKGMEFRISRLEQQMTALEPKMETSPEVKQVYWSSYERHNELTALLQFIKNEGCGPKACGGCATPCSSKRG